MSSSGFIRIIGGTLLFFAVCVNPSFAQVETKWFPNGVGEIALQASSNLSNPSSGKTMLLIMRMEDVARCLPSFSFLLFDGLKLGDAINQKSYTSSKNKLHLTVNGKAFSAQGKTVVNTYSNGVELVALFDPSILAALQRSAVISVALGDHAPLEGFSVANSARDTIGLGYESCF